MESTRCDGGIKTGFTAWCTIKMYEARVEVVFCGCEGGSVVGGQLTRLHYGARNGQTKADVTGRHPDVHPLITY